MQLYRDGEMGLDQLMAFTLSDDQTAQEAAWSDLQTWNRGPQAIRASLTQAHVSAQDPRVKFVEVDAYVAAGGAVIKDLFQSDHDGYLADPALLDRLVSANLETAAEAVRAEGWTWVDILPKLDYSDINKFGSTAGDTVTTNIYLETVEREHSSPQGKLNSTHLLSECGKSRAPTVTCVPTSEGYHYTTMGMLGPEQAPGTRTNTKMF
jgi:hypothetical protein